MYPIFSSTFLVSHENDIISDDIVIVFTSSAIDRSQVRSNQRLNNWHLLLLPRTTSSINEQTLGIKVIFWLPLWYAQSCTHKASLSPPRFIKVPVSSQVSIRSSICVLWVSSLPMFLRYYDYIGSSTSSYNQNIFSYRHDIDETLFT
jgi:hypothetical protein